MTKVNCYNCNKEFNINPSRLKNKFHHCSKECLGITNSKRYSQKIKTNCVVCSKEIFYKKSRYKNIIHHTCSLECKQKMYSKTRKGINNGNYKHLTEFERYFHEKTTSLRNNAKSRKIPFNLVKEDLIEVYNKQKGKCFYSGEEFFSLKKDKIRYNTLSVDRLDNSKGYEKDNIVMCLNCINMLKSSFPLSEIKKVFRSIYKKEKTKVYVKFKKIYEDANLPAKQTEKSAGYDCFVYKIEEFENHLKIYTGISIQPEDGFYSILTARSSLHKKGLMLYNNIGIIDADFTGEIVAILLKTKDYKEGNLKVGERFGQLILQELIDFDIVEVDNFEETKRGSGSFGSTGN